MSLQEFMVGLSLMALVISGAVFLVRRRQSSMKCDESKQESARQYSENLSRMRGQLMEISVREVFGEADETARDMMGEAHSEVLSLFDLVGEMEHLTTQATYISAVFSCKIALSEYLGVMSLIQPEKALGFAERFGLPEPFSRSEYPFCAKRLVERMRRLRGTYQTMISQ